MSERSEMPEGYGKVCIHGQLARSCPHCEAQAEIAGLLSELETWQAMHKARGRHLEQRTTERDEALAEVARMSRDLSRARRGMREGLGAAAELRQLVRWLWRELLQLEQDTSTPLETRARIGVIRQHLFDQGCD